MPDSANPRRLSRKVAHFMLQCAMNSEASAYNTERRHSALGDLTPAARLAHFLSTTC